MESSQWNEVQQWVAEKGSVQLMWGKRRHLWMCLKFQHKAIAPDYVYTVTDLLSLVLFLYYLASNE